jgi:hypothetical protein
MGFPSGSVKNLPAMQEPQETQVQSLGWKDPLGEKMATHSSILAWRVLWAEEPCGLQSMGSQRVRHNWVTNSFISHVCVCIHICMYVCVCTYVYTSKFYSEKLFTKLSTFSTTTKKKRQAFQQVAPSF